MAYGSPHQQGPEEGVTIAYGKGVGSNAEQDTKVEI